ncbi:MAG: PAS domain-containing sensor histidine kinase [Chitinophagaceae bacterium]|nr:PAS domain-containing sensor histidine kinase [Chitinophagaceae bacterium]
MKTKLIIEDAEDLYQNAPFGYLTVQSDGLIININSTLLHWLGYERQEIEFQKSFQDLLIMGDKIYYETHIMPMLLVQNEIAEINIQLKGKGLIRLPVLINAKRIVDSTNQESFFRFSLLDITQRRKYELELMKARKEAETTVQQLKEIKQDLEQFAYVVAHDLKTPLRSIKGLLSIIKNKGDKMDNTKKQEYFNVVINAADDMYKLIDSLLEYARTGSVQEEMQEVTVSGIFKTQLNFFEQEIKKLGGQIETHSTIKYITVYPVLFQQVLMNLISNAIKYRSETPPIIQVTCKDQKGYTLFSVTDNGMGIPTDRFEAVFKLFRSLNPNNDSNGIGLAICKKIIELHGGTIWLESEIGKGTTFYFTIRKD